MTILLTILGDGCLISHSPLKIKYFFFLGFNVVANTFKDHSIHVSFTRDVATKVSASAKASAQPCRSFGLGKLFLEIYTLVELERKKAKGPKT